MPTSLASNQEGILETRENKRLLREAVLFYLTESGMLSYLTESGMLSYLTESGMLSYLTESGMLSCLFGKSDRQVKK